MTKKQRLVASLTTTAGILAAIGTSTGCYFLAVNKGTSSSSNVQLEPNQLDASRLQTIYNSTRDYLMNIHENDPTIIDQTFLDKPETKQAIKNKVENDLAKTNFKIDFIKEFHLKHATGENNHPLVTLSLELDPEAEIKWDTLVKDPLVSPGENNIITYKKPINLDTGLILNNEVLNTIFNSINRSLNTIYASNPDHLETNYLNTTGINDIKKQLAVDLVDAGFKSSLITKFEFDVQTPAYNKKTATYKLDFNTKTIFEGLANSDVYQVVDKQIQMIKPLVFKVENIVNKNDINKIQESVDKVIDDLVLPNKDKVDQDFLDNNKQTITDAIIDNGFNPDFIDGDINININEETGDITVVVPLQPDINIDSSSSNGNVHVDPDNHTITIDKNVDLTMVLSQKRLDTLYQLINTKLMQMYNNDPQNVTLAKVNSPEVKEQIASDLEVQTKFKKSHIQSISFTQRAAINNQYQLDAEIQFDNDTIFATNLSSTQFAINKTAKSVKTINPFDFSNIKVVNSAEINSLINVVKKAMDDKYNAHEPDFNSACLDALIEPIKSTLTTKGFDVSLIKTMSFNVQDNGATTAQIQLNPNVLISDITPSLDTTVNPITKLITINKQYDLTMVLNQTRVNELVKLIKTKLDEIYLNKRTDIRIDNLNASNLKQTIATELSTKTNFQAALIKDITFSNNTTTANTDYAIDYQISFNDGVVFNSDVDNNSEIIVNKADKTIKNKTPLNFDLSNYVVTNQQLQDCYRICDQRIGQIVREQPEVIFNNNEAPSEIYQDILQKIETEVGLKPNRITKIRIQFKHRASDQNWYDIPFEIQFANNQILEPTAGSRWTLDESNHKVVATHPRDFAFANYFDARRSQILLDVMKQHLDNAYSQDNASIMVDKLMASNIRQEIMNDFFAKAQFNNRNFMNAQTGFEFVDVQRTANHHYQFKIQLKLAGHYPDRNPNQLWITGDYKNDANFDYDNNKVSLITKTYFDFDISKFINNENVNKIKEAVDQFINDKYAGDKHQFTENNLSGTDITNKVKDAISSTQGNPDLIDIVDTKINSSTNSVDTVIKFKPTTGFDNLIGNENIIINSEDKTITIKNNNLDLSLFIDDNRLVSLNEAIRWILTECFRREKNIFTDGYINQIETNKAAVISAFDNKFHQLANFPTGHISSLTITNEKRSLPNGQPDRAYYVHTQVEFDNQVIIIANNNNSLFTINNQTVKVKKPLKFGAWIDQDGKEEFCLQFGNWLSKRWDHKLTEAELNTPEISQEVISLFDRGNEINDLIERVDFKIQNIGENEQKLTFSMPFKEGLIVSHEREDLLKEINSCIVNQVEYDVVFNQNSVVNKDGVLISLTEAGKNAELLDLSHDGIISLKEECLPSVIKAKKIVFGPEFSKIDFEYKNTVFVGDNVTSSAVEEIDLSQCIQPPLTVSKSWFKPLIKTPNRFKLTTPVHTVALNSTLGSWKYFNMLDEIECPIDLFIPDGSFIFEGFCSSVANLETVHAEGINELNDHSFRDCKKLKTFECDLTKSNACTKIGKYAFLGDNSLTKCDLFSHESPVTIIDESAFAGCGSLENVVWPKGLTNIEDYAFNGAHIKFKDQASVQLPDTIAKIGQHVFQITSESSSSQNKIAKELFLNNDTPITKAMLTPAKSWCGGIEVDYYNELLGVGGSLSDSICPARRDY